MHISFIKALILVYLKSLTALFLLLSQDVHLLRTLSPNPHPLSSEIKLSSVNSLEGRERGGFSFCEETIIIGFFSYFLCDWARKFARLSQPIRCKTKANDGLIARVFPRFKQFGCFYYKFSSALKGFPILLNGLSSYFGFGYMTLDRKAVYGG